jgi:arylsulfatase A-like enzyme
MRPTEVPPERPAKTGREPFAAGAFSRGTWFVLALTIGLGSGFTEVVFQGIRRFLLDHWIRVGPHTVWMVPLAQGLLFALLGMVAELVWRLRSDRRTAVVILTILLGVAASPEALLQPWIDRRAALVVIAGCALQASRLLIDRRRRLVLAARRMLPAFGIALILAFAVPIALSWRERRRLRTLPSAEGRPSVLLIFLDTVRAASLSAYGYERPTTPFLERFSKDAVRFDRAYAPSSWTLPTHASALTGRWPHELSADWNTPLDDHFPTLAEAFRSGSYATGAFMANPMYTDTESGLARGFIRYRVYPVTAAEVLACWSIGQWASSLRWVRRTLGSQEILNRKVASDVRKEFFDWLDQLGQHPFFAVLNYFDAHEPYLPPPPYDQAFGNGRIRWNPRLHFGPRSVALHEAERRAMSGEEQAENAAAYLGTIRYLDHELEQLVQELGRRGLLDRMIVVITSDHGETLGEGGRFMHGEVFSDLTTRVPLLMRYPVALSPGRSVSREVSLRDLPATLIELAELSGPPDELPGHSLVPLALGQSESAETASPAVSSWWAWRSTPARNWSVVSGWLRLEEHDDGTEALYDLRRDPYEGNNLLAMGSPGIADTVARLRSILDSLRATTTISPRPNPGEAVPVSRR